MGQRRRVALAGTATLAAAGVVLGVGVALSIATADGVDGMRGLGVLVTGLLVSGVLALVTAVAVAVVTIRHVLPPGSRAVPLAVLVGGLVATVALAFALQNLWLLLLVVVAVLVPAAVVRPR